MKYSELITFQPIESVIQLRDANRKESARKLVASYVISNEMCQRLSEVVIPHLQYEKPHDNKGIFYSRYPEPKKGAKFQGLPLNQKLYYHRLGTPQSEDVLVYHRPDQPKWSVTGGVSDDGRYLVIYVGDGTTSRKTRIVSSSCMTETTGTPSLKTPAFSRAILPSESPSRCV